MRKKVVLEFSDNWLKAIVSAPLGIKHRIEKIIFEPLGPELSGVSASLERIFQQIGTKKNLEVLVCLSRNKITVRQLDLPSREPDEISQMLSLHVIRQVPYPKDEIVWSYQNLGFDGISNSHILLAIAHRQMLRDIFNAFTALNMLPDAMLMSSQGVIHYLNEVVRDKSLLQDSYLVLDIDYNSSELILVNKYALRSTVVISKGAEQLKNEAERIQFGAELKQALVVFNSEVPNSRPTRIIFCGAVEQLQYFIQETFGKEFNLKPSFVKAQETQDLRLKGSEDISFSAALGFAYNKKKEDLNFNLPEAQIKREIKTKTKQLLTLSICLSYVFIILGALVLVRINQLQSYRDKLNKRLAQLKDDTGGIFDISQKINIVRQYWGVKQSVLSSLYELSRACPENITITNFSWEWQKSFSVRGYASEMSDVSGFVSILEKSGLFKAVETRYMRRRKSKDKEVVDFELGIK
jgi:Tfp pilus assembly protein PilN